MTVGKNKRVSNLIFKIKRKLCTDKFVEVNCEEMVSIRSGLPMSEESLAEWQKAFSDIEESIAVGIYKKGVDL